jgi:hypothetical protein
MNTGITNTGIQFQYKTPNWFQTLFKYQKQKYKIDSEVQSNLSNSKLKGPPKKKNRFIQEFKVGKLCTKYVIVKVPIIHFKLFMNLNYISSNQTSLTVQK